MLQHHEQQQQQNGSACAEIELDEFSPRTRITVEPPSSSPVKSVKAKKMVVTTSFAPISRYVGLSFGLRRSIKIRWSATNSTTQIYHDNWKQCKPKLLHR